MVQETIDDYRHLWEDKDGGWVLMRLPVGEGTSESTYGIGNSLDRSALIIEDNAIYHAAILEMLRHGVTILDPPYW